ncbi:hypothetical protein AGMMS50239_06150 [Bacteroidia bacterium]|nr:hypothetical protein AGMMS50239_06150 [Bacteroidia bacterium]
MAEYHFNLPPITQLTIPQQAALYETKQIALSGGPGTGKSVVSLWRHISNLRKKQKSLLLTYATTLKMYFRNACLAEAKKTDIDDETRKSFKNAADTVNSSLKGKPKTAIIVQEIIVDEAQDLPINYYEYIKRIAKVSYGADDSQILYPDNCSYQRVLKKVFPDNVDYVLDKNFRSTQRIMKFAKVAFPEAYIPTSIIEGLSNNVGELPVMLISGKNKWIEEERKFEISNNKQDNAILRIITPLKTTTQNVAIIVPWKKDAIYFENVIKNSIPDYSIYYEDEDRFPNGCEAIKNVHITTFKSSKGLEFDTVIIPNFYDLSKIDVNIIIEGITTQNKEELEKGLSEILNCPIQIKEKQTIIYLKIKTVQFQSISELVKKINGLKIRIEISWRDVYVGVTRARSNLYLISSFDIPQLNTVTDKQIL